MTEKVKLPIRGGAIVILIFVTLNLLGQAKTVITKDDQFRTEKQALIDTLNNRINIDCPFVIGRYHPPVNDTVNHPYFNSNKWINGSLFYDGRFYSVENLKYDIETDHLIHLKLTSLMLDCIAMDENFISEFRLANQTFRYYSGLRDKRGGKVKDGYYEVVFDGKLKFLVRSEKSLSIKEGANYLVYSTWVRMYLLKENKMISINSLSGLLKQLNRESRDSVKKFIRNNLLKLNSSNYTSASTVLHFYENRQGL
ncbi:MAG: hypothetical protein Q8909_11840 [Bacteroidota bacterium]|nr:hypothetical protein [Bacteroidota bacterium]